MKVITQETLYMKNMVLLWSTSVEKRIVALPLFIYFLFFWGGLLFFLWPFSFFGTMLYWMMIITLLFTYNSRITTRYLEQDMTLYECLRRCTGMCNDAWVTCMKIMNGGFATNTMSTTWLCKQYDNDEACHNNETMESCMTICLGMAMQMP